MNSRHVNILTCSDVHSLRNFIINQARVVCVFSDQNVQLLCGGVKIERFELFSKAAVGDDLGAGSSQGKYASGLHQPFSPQI